jgi:hypothetical protein
VDKLFEVEEPVDKSRDVIKEVTVEKIGHSPPPFPILSPFPCLLSLSLYMYTFVCTYAYIIYTDLYRDILTLVNWQCLLRTSR